MTTDPKSGVAPLASAFSSAVFKQLAKVSLEPGALKRIALIANCAPSEQASLAASFDHAHAHLMRSYRSEYVFKNALVSKLVFGKHSPRYASALIEFRMGNSWADVVIVNGTTTTYEIKTDLDHFTRLTTQIDDYEGRSEFVNVVTSDRRAAAAEACLPPHIGVVAIRKRGALTTIRPAESNLERMSSERLFTMLRTNEALSILQKTRGYELDVPSGDAWKRLHGLFGELPIDDAHAEVVAHLRRRGRAAAELATGEGFPASLRALAYSSEFSAIGRRRILRRLNTPAPLFLEG